MLTANKYVKNEFKAKEIIGWGSLYSAALILRLAGENTKLVDAADSFAPGEYFANLGMPADWISQAAKNITVPVFITSAKSEKSNWENIYNSINAKGKMMSLPETEGNHGSRALWDIFEDSSAYWSEIKVFLNSIKSKME